MLPDETFKAPQAGRVEAVVARQLHIRGQPEFRFYACTPNMDVAGSRGLPWFA
jgi:hypothetical protein